MWGDCLLTMGPAWMINVTRPLLGLWVYPLINHVSRTKRNRQLLILALLC
jgi:hypothetical protein